MEKIKLDNYKKLFSKDNEKVKKYLSFLEEVNSKTNLVSPNDIEFLYERHFLDSLALEFLIKDTNKVLDIGSGGGFPAIPLKIVLPNLEITCVESRVRKTLFLKRVSKKINFENFEVITERVENIESSNNNSYDIITSRATDSTENIIKMGLPFIKKSGKFILFKANGTQIPSIINLKSKEIKIVNKEIYKYEIKEINFKGEIHSFSVE